jgi:hypothetical protein
MRTAYIYKLPIDRRIPAQGRDTGTFADKREFGLNKTPGGVVASRAVTYI